MLSLGIITNEATLPLGIITNEVTDSLGATGVTGSLGIITNEVTDSLGGAPEDTSTWKWFVAITGVLGAAGLAYHGYRRTGSTAAAIGWGILGAIFPINLVAGGVAAAQGLGKKKGSRK
jgi:hypothetical protein